jgi:hypothetical protein
LTKLRGAEYYGLSLRARRITSGDSIWKETFGNPSRECPSAQLRYNINSNRKEEVSPPALMMPGVLKDGNEDDLDLNIFDFFPDPVHFVELLKQLDRGDIASSIFIKLLEDYRDMKARSNEDSIKYVFFLRYG